ncbi:MAG: chondroitinase-B domain-containing protein [Bacteroidota bacterium]
MKEYLKSSIVVLLISIVLSFQLSAKNILVSTAAQITTALSSIAPGDTITMATGTWTNQAIVFKATGTAANPILLRAQTNQGVLLNGTSTLRIAGKYLIVEGLRFEGGYSPSGAVIEFQGTDYSASSNCRLTRTSIKSYNPASIATDYKWVSLYGQNNRVDHCAFENKTHMGTTLVVWLTSANVPNYHRVDSNYFGPRPILVDLLGNPVNGGETIRVGTSDYSMNDSYTTVESNIFDRCDGEIEAISNKSCENIYRYNVFTNCQGMLTLRHGNRCSVYGNYFFCNNVPNSGGIRIIGEDHKVYNNYVENSAGSSMKTGITIVNGVPNSPLNRYFQVKRAKIVHNTLIGNRYSMNIGAGKDAELTLPPLDCEISNNIVWSTKEQLITYTDTPLNMTYAGNIFYGSSLGITKPAGITIVNPALTFASDSIWHTGSSSPAVNASVGSYPFVTKDIDGQTRTVPFDAGADEYSIDPVLQRPIRKSEVGPLAVVTLVQNRPESIAPSSFAVLNNYPNPFNPSTTVEFSVPVNGHVSLNVYNGAGELIEELFNYDAEKDFIYRMNFDGSRFASGMYFAELHTQGSVTVRKLLLLK